MVVTPKHIFQIIKGVFCFRICQFSQQVRSFLRTVELHTICRSVQLDHECEGLTRSTCRDNLLLGMGTSAVISTNRGFDPIRDDPIPKNQMVIFKDMMGKMRMPCTVSQGERPSRNWRQRQPHRQYECLEFHNPCPGLISFSSIAVAGSRIIWSITFWRFTSTR